jgi:dihydrofolate reductase
MLQSVDTFVLGRRMYPEYEKYWMEVLAHPTGALPSSGRKATKDEVAFARRADKTPHFVVSKSLDKVTWKATRIVREIEEIRKMKQQPGKDIYVVGGATLVSSLMNVGLVDELRLLVNPIVLGKGKSLFKDVSEPHPLKLVRSKRLQSGQVSLTYTTHV